MQVTRSLAHHVPLFYCNKVGDCMCVTHCVSRGIGGVVAVVLLLGFTDVSHRLSRNTEAHCLSS